MLHQNATKAAAALAALAEHGIPPDVQELLIAGSLREGIRPGAIMKMIDAVLAVRDDQ